MKKIAFWEKKWNQWSLRSRLLAIMLSIAILVVVVSTTGVALGSLRMQSLVNQYSRQMTATIGGAVGSAFYQQNMCIYGGIVQAQAAFLCDLSQEEGADGEALLGAAARYFEGTFPEVWSPQGSSFVWKDGQMYAGADVLPTMERILAENEIDMRAEERLAESAQERFYTAGEQGFFLLWEPFGEDERIGLLMPASNSYDLTVALTEMLQSESEIASQGVRSATVSSMLLSLGVIALLLILLPPIARKLAGVIVTPVEREQARRERELALAAEEKRMLEELDRNKTQFLANISHELKTPLTVVSNYAQSSAQGLSAMPEAETEARAMRMIVTEVNRMALLVNQLLDVSRIDEGRLVLNKKPIQIDELVKRTLDTYAPILQQDGNRLAFQRVYDLPEIEADEVRIQEVLVNLLSNAAKHTRGGVVRVGMAQLANAVEISVSDTGEGIAPDRIGHVFERFNAKETRADAKTSTGLGLYLCKSFVEAHGGAISVESKQGEGTTVRFTLPLQG